MSLGNITSVFRRYVKRPGRRDRNRRGRRPHHHRRRRRDNGRKRRLDFPILNFVGAYLLALIALCTAVAWSIPVRPPGSFLLIAIAYFGIGTLLIRYISRRVILNVNYATIASVANAKLRDLYRWPLTVPVFIGQTMIARHL